MVNGVRTVYESFTHPLNLASVHDQTVYMIMGRAISAFFGTLTIPVTYAIATRISGRRAGLFAAALLAASVLHLRDSHFATTDITMTFFCALTLWLSLKLAERASWTMLIACGAAVGLALATKYAAAFVLAVVGLAYFMAPGRPAAVNPISKWITWALRGLTPIAAAAATSCTGRSISYCGIWARRSSCWGSTTAGTCGSPTARTASARSAKTARSSSA
jgi:predicted membrane-bound mannosyltransferase